MTKEVTPLVSDEQLSMGGITRRMNLMTGVETTIQGPLLPEQVRAIYEKERSALLREVEALREATRWIPVSEKLPEPTTVAIVTFYDHDECRSWVNVARLTKSMRWSSYPNGRIFKEPYLSITHWMPFPSHPT